MSERTSSGCVLCSIFSLWLFPWLVILCLMNTLVCRQFSFLFWNVMNCNRLLFKYIIECVLSFIFIKLLNPTWTLSICPVLFWNPSPEVSSVWLPVCVGACFLLVPPVSHHPVTHVCSCQLVFAQWSSAAAGFFLHMTSLFGPMTQAFKWWREGLCFIVPGNSSVEHLNLCLGGNTFLPPASRHHQPHGGAAAFDFIYELSFAIISSNPDEKDI